MAEPVDSAADFLAMVGRNGPVGLKVYRPGGASGSGDEDWADAVEVTGNRGPKRVEPADVGDGQVRATRSTWWLTPAGSSLDGTRPTLKSLIVDGSEAWIIDSVSPDGRDAVFQCETTLSNG